MFYDGRIDYTRRGVVSMAADWGKIKAEYLTTGISYRELGKKYGVHYTNIAKRASSERWPELRQQQTNTTLTQTLTAVTNDSVERATRLGRTADLLLQKIEAGITAAPIVTPTAAKNYSDALKNIKEIHMIRTAEEIEEQQARIAKLKKEVQDDDKTKTITVTLEGDLSRYAK